MTESDLLILNDMYSTLKDAYKPWKEDLRPDIFHEIDIAYNKLNDDPKINKQSSIPYLMQKIQMMCALAPMTNALYEGRMEVHFYMTMKYKYDTWLKIQDKTYQDEIVSHITNAVQMTIEYLRSLHYIE